MEKPVATGVSQIFAPPGLLKPRNAGECSIAQASAMPNPKWQ